MWCIVPIPERDKKNEKWRLTWTWKCPWLDWKTSPHRCQQLCPWIRSKNQTNFSPPTWTFFWLSTSWSYPLFLREVPQKPVSWILSAVGKPFWRIFFQYISSNKTNLIIFEAKFAILERNVNSARSLGRISVKNIIWSKLKNLFFFHLWTRTLASCAFQDRP